MATIKTTELRCGRKQHLSCRDEPSSTWAAPGKARWARATGSTRTSPGLRPQHLGRAQGEERERWSKPLGSWTVSNVAASNTKVTASSPGFHDELFYDVEA